MLAHRKESPPDFVEEEARASGARDQLERHDPRSCDFPTTGWKSLATARTSSACFTVGTMLKYFLDSDAGDGESARNFKAVSSTDNKALRLYQRGYVQKIELARVEDHVFTRGDVNVK